jgi:hypothetical protein
MVASDENSYTECMCSGVRSTGVLQNTPGTPEYSGTP